MIRFSSCMAPSMESMCRDIVRLAADRLGVATGFVGDIGWQAREQAFMAGAIDVLWICGLPYVWNWDDVGERAHLLAAPVMQGPRYAGEPVYYSDVVVHRRSGLKSFDDLRGRRFVYNEPRSHSGYNVMRHHLSERGERRGFFGSARQSGAHQHSIEWILDGLADAAAIDSTVLELELARRPALQEDLAVIGTLGPSPMPPWVARAGFDPSRRDDVREFLLALHEDLEGRMLLDRCRIDHFAAIGDDHYDPIRRMAHEADGVVL